MEGWIPRFVCPECRNTALAEARDTGALVCPRGPHRFERRGGVFRMLSPRRAAVVAPFVRQYRLVREREGFRSMSPEDRRRLPHVAPGHPRAREWRVRGETFANLLRHALPMGSGPLRILDLGAGSGWLSYRLAAAGHRVVAVDWLDDEADGLGAVGNDPMPITAVQADFDALPLEPGQFDLAVFDASLHYARDPRTTLAEARRMLDAGGALAVMDSPMFARERDGEGMVADQLRRMRDEYGVEDPLLPGAGFLTFDELDLAGAGLGLRGRFIASRGPLAWRVRRRMARLRLGRSPAAFGLWVGQ